MGCAERITGRLYRVKRVLTGLSLSKCGSSVGVPVASPERSLSPLAFVAMIRTAYSMSPCSDVPVPTEEVDGGLPS